MLVFRAPIADIGATVTPYATLTGPILAGGNFVQHLYVDRTLVAADIQPIDKLVILQDGTMRVAGTPSIVGSPQEITVAGDHVFWEDWDGPIRLATDSISGPAEYLVDLAPTEVHGLSTDGSVLTWLQAYVRHPDYTFDRVELWTSPLATHPSDLKPRLVQTFPNHGHEPGITGGGWYAWAYEGGLGTEVISLADGTKRRWTPPADLLAPFDPIAISATEMLQPALQAGVHILVRIDPHTLPVE